MNISLIVAMSQNRGIGKDNQLLWHLPTDLKRFKEITMGKPVVMGRKTFDSIMVSLGKPLPGRANLVLTSNPNINEVPNSRIGDYYCFNTIDKLLKRLDENYKNKEIMIIGGAQVYKQFLNLANKIYLTLVDTKLDADAFFPEIDLNVWRQVNQDDHFKDEKHQYDYSFREYIRTL